MVETPDGDNCSRNRYHLRKTKENPDPKEAADITPCRSLKVARLDFFEGIPPKFEH